MKEKEWRDLEEGPYPAQFLRFREVTSALPALGQWDRTGSGSEVSDPESS